MQEKNNKNICFFSGDITNSGGTERVATIIASELAKEKSKYNIYFVSLFEKRKESFFYLDSSIKRYKLYDTPLLVMSPEKKQIFLLFFSCINPIISFN